MLKKESFEYLKNEMIARAGKIIPILGLEGTGITIEDLGITEEFVTKIINDMHLKIFTAEEIEEMISFDKKYSKRRGIIDDMIAEEYMKLVDSFKDDFLKKLEGAL